jgi:hypothetical protein
MQSATIYARHRRASLLILGSFARQFGVGKIDNGQ